MNDYSDIRFTYDLSDLVKARIAMEYLTATTPYYWYIDIVVE